MYRVLFCERRKRFKKTFVRAINKTRSIVECQNGVHVNTRARRHGDDIASTNTPGRTRTSTRRRRTPRGDFYVRVRRVRARSCLRFARAQLLQRENESIVGENASVSLVDVERVHPDLGPAGRGILAEQNERRRGRERTNDGRDVGIDVLVDVFSHLGDFTVAPDLRGQVEQRLLSITSRIFTWAVVEYIYIYRCRRRRLFSIEAYYCAARVCEEEYSPPFFLS